MERTKAYATSYPGGVTYDIEGMALDLITLIKACRVMDKDTFLHGVAQMWDECEVRVTRSSDH